MVSVNLGALHYVLDHIYGSILHRAKIGTPFFSKGWGGTNLELLERMVNQLFPNAASLAWPPTVIKLAWKTKWETNSACLREGSFPTPCEEELVHALPPESHTARVAFLVPKSVPAEKMACVVHLAGTGDHTFERRLKLGAPLLKQNIATMVLERNCPYYGNRRPIMQRGSKLLCVSDLLLLGKATIDESRSLLHWLEAEAGFSKTGICGLSMDQGFQPVHCTVMPKYGAGATSTLYGYSCCEPLLGGVHAAMVGALHPTPIATLPFLAPHSAVVPFCEGLYQHATAWDALKEDASHPLAKSNGEVTLEQVKEKLRSVLSLTDVTKFPVPKNPNAVIFVAATDDGYIPKHSVLELQKAWPGSEVRWVTGGHVSSFFLHGDAFRKAIVDGLNRLPWRKSSL